MKAVYANSHPAGAQRVVDNPLKSHEVLVLLEKRPSADTLVSGHDPQCHQGNVAMHMTFMPFTDTMSPRKVQHLAWFYLSSTFAACDLFFWWPVVHNETLCGRIGQLAPTMLWRLRLGSMRKRGRGGCRLRSGTPDVEVVC
jgi:hypothetical protein